jgi:hypothetical protein
VNNTNNYTARESLKIAADILYTSMRDKFDTDDLCWEWVWGRKLAPSQVRLEVQLNATSNTFKFGLTEKQSNSNNLQFNTEKRLDQSDILIVNQYALYVGKPADDDDTLWQLRTYGNIVDFGAADAAVINQTFYSHGFYSVMVNNDNVIPYRRLGLHHYIPKTQQTAALGANSPNDQFRGAEDGYITQEANLLLIGNKGYIPQINFPTNLAITGATLRAIIIYDGVLAQNASLMA